VVQVHLGRFGQVCKERIQMYLRSFPLLLPFILYINNPCLLRTGEHADLFGSQAQNNGPMPFLPPALAFWDLKPKLIMCKSCVLPLRPSGSLQPKAAFLHKSSFSKLYIFEALNLDFWPSLFPFNQNARVLSGVQWKMVDA